LSSYNFFSALSLLFRSLSRAHANPPLSAQNKNALCRTSEPTSHPQTLRLPLTNTHNQKQQQPPNNTKKSPKKHPPKNHKTNKNKNKKQKQKQKQKQKPKATAA
jgi:hypothetical protein